MDCREALNILEAVRPCSDDLNDPQFAEAVAWLNSDEECARLFAVTHQLDVQIGQVMREVPVPAGLKKELIASLGLADTNQSDQTESLTELATPAPVSNSRRRWLAAVVSSVACLVIGLFAWQHFSTQPELLNIADLQKMGVQQMENWDKLPSYSGSFSDPKTTLGYQWTNGSISTTSAPKGLPATQSSNHPIALFGFQVKSHGIPHFDGVILVVDATSVANPPDLEYFSASQASYIATTEGNLPTVVWREADRVYICIVRNAQTLEILESALSVSPA